MTKILGRDDFLSLKKELVDVPELNGSVWMRELTTEHLLAFNERVEELKKVEGAELTPSTSFNLMALAVSFSACDENDQLIFSEDDVTKLVQHRIPVLMRLSNKAMEISGLAMVGDKLASEVAINLKKNQNKSLPSASAKNSTKRKRKSNHFPQVNI